MAALLPSLPLLLAVWDVDAQRSVWHGGQAASWDADGDMPTLMDRLHPDDVNRLHAHLQRVAALPDGSHARQRFRLRQPGGGWRWFESHDTVLLRHADGRAAQLAVCGQDISESQGSEAVWMADRRGVASDLHDDAPLALIGWDSDLHVRRWAGGAERLFGWSVHDAIGMRLSDLSLVHADDAAAVAEVVRRLLSGTPSVVWTNRNVARDGRVLHCTWHNTARVDAAGKVTGVVSMVQDITEQRRAEDALRASEQRHRLLAETMLHGVVYQDANGRILEMNPAAEHILGKTREGFIGSDSVSEEHDTLRDDGSPFPGHEHPAMRALRTGEPVRGVVMGVWNPQRRQRRWLRVESAPLPVLAPKADHGGVPGVFSLFEDITERRRDEAALRQTNQRLAIALSIAQTIVFEQDTALRYTWIRDEAVDVVPLLGRQDEEIMECAEQAATLRQFKQAVLDSGMAARHEVQMQYLGQLRDFDLRLEPLRDAQGRVEGLIGAAQDITARKRDERALREADRHKDLFIATLAHELRNPLAPILHAAALLRDRAVHSGDAQASKAGAVIERQVAQMARLLEDLLDVARVASGRMSLRLEKLDLVTVVQQAVDTARPLIDAASHQLELALPTVPMMVSGDSTRLLQVCANLLTNAAKYTRPGGRIVVTAAQQVDGAATWAVVRVRDTGIGLAPEHLRNVFEMFSQVEGALDRSQGGLGIGLALAKGLVEIHGGQISVHSEGPGRGCEFVVRLPAPAIQPASAQPSVPAVVPPRAKLSRKVLVVDDNHDAAEMLQLILASSGHQMRIAHDGEAALRLAREEMPDVALLDIGLPRMSGHALCRALRALPGGESLLVVAISGWGLPADRRLSAEAGFDLHLVKPVDIDQLEALLANGAGRPKSDEARI